jgi:hypothetical protein
MRWCLLRPIAWRLRRNARPLEQSICYSFNIRRFIYFQFPQPVATLAALHEHDGIVATALIFPYQYRHLATTPQLCRAVRVVASKGTHDVGGVFIADALVGVGAVEVWSRCNVCSNCGCDFVVIAWIHARAFWGVFSWLGSSFLLVHLGGSTTLMKVFNVLENEASQERL